MLSTDPYLAQRTTPRRPSAPAPRDDLGDWRSRVLDAIDGAGRHHVLQPIVDVRTRTAVGAEALARFATAPFAPDLWFAAAERVGLRIPLEIAAARTALTSLDSVAGYLSINLSPDAITSGALDALLAGVDRSRVVVEITEHQVVDDYATLAAALAPHRGAGLRLAIDDAGAGYASFRHILKLSPDYIKIDMSLVRDINLDPVRQALTASLLTFARTAGAQLIAEGVETQAELDLLARLGVTLVQGYLLGRPCDTPATTGYAGPSRHVIIDGAAGLADVLAQAVRDGHDLEQLTRPLLDAVLGITGLETSYLTVLHDDGALEHRYVRNAGAIELPEGFALPWEDSLCSLMREKDLLWTNDAPTELAERPVAAAFGLATYVSAPMSGGDGRIIGTLCAGSREALYISDAAVAQLQLIAHVIATELRNARRP
jgi:EAL domain-containing protein (putative c-di-GMP-specific phosphodiesterase class I)